MAHFIEFKNVTKIYKTGTQAIIAQGHQWYIKGISFVWDKGRWTS